MKYNTSEVDIPNSIRRKLNITFAIEDLRRQSREIFNEYCEERYINVDHLLMYEEMDDYAEEQLQKLLKDFDMTNLSDYDEVTDEYYIDVLEGNI